MSQYLFGSGRGKIKPSIRKRIDAIANRHDADFVNPNMPGEGWRFWFAGPNLGHPFDRAMANAVWEDLIKAGLADADGLLDKVFA